MWHKNVKVYEGITPSFAFKMVACKVAHISRLTDKYPILTEFRPQNENSLSNPSLSAMTAENQ